MKTLSHRQWSQQNRELSPPNLFDYFGSRLLPLMEAPLSCWFYNQREICQGSANARSSSLISKTNAWVLMSIPCPPTHLETAFKDARTLVLQQESLFTRKSGICVSCVCRMEDKGKHILSEDFRKFVLGMGHKGGGWRVLEHMT